MTLTLRQTLSLFEMGNNNQQYSVKSLARLAGVSVRTLHYYDKIGLLTPAQRSENGYRYYRKAELYRLQQIMFYKTIGYGLADIKEMLDKEGFDIITSLRFQKKTLTTQYAELKKLITTIDKTINELKNKEGMITDKELYEGFTEKQAQKMRNEATERWGDEVGLVEKDIKAMSKQGWRDIKQEAEEINLWLANLIHKPVEHAEVQKVVYLHFQHMNKFYKVSEVRYRGLADMYVQDERFKQYYEAVKPGLANFLSKGIHKFCDNGMRCLD